QSIYTLLIPSRRNPYLAVVSGQQGTGPTRRLPTLERSYSVDSSACMVKSIEHGAWSERERQQEAGRKRHGDAAKNAGKDSQVIGDG
ncbi:MAG: hypothetical protein PVH81_13200, partial [Syntrophobacterales bacterium]